MLYMVVERLQGGDPRPVYERFHEALTSPEASARFGGARDGASS